MGSDNQGEASPSALLAAAELDYRGGRFAEAERRYRQLLLLRPDDEDILHRLAVTEIQLGHLDGGVSLMQRALALNPARIACHFDLAATYVRLGRLQDAIKAIGSAIKVAPNSELAFGNLVHLALRCARGRAPLDTGTTAALGRGLRSVSVIVCSNDKQRAERIKARYDALFAGHEYELIQVFDPGSLCEGYNRGIAQSSGDILVFSHDDVEIVSRDFVAHLIWYLSIYDIIGVAGTTQLMGETWVLAGWPRLHGCIVHRHLNGIGFNFECYGPPSADPIQAVDGVFIAANRNVCETLRFDEQTFDGFHFYDLDFSYRAFLAGFRIGVPWDILLVHDSTGQRSAEWRRYADIFMAKYGSRMKDLPPPSQIKWPCIALRDQTEVVTFHQAMVAGLTPA